MDETTTRMADVVAEALAALWLAEHAAPVTAAAVGDPVTQSRRPHTVTPPTDANIDGRAEAK